ncbi:MAG TPA: toll/interleukin-1 receptor domain-containing protein [Thermoanaerobaculia bacterium]
MECAVCGTRIIKKGAIACPRCGSGHFSLRDLDAMPTAKDLYLPETPLIDISVCHAARDSRAAALIAKGLRNRGMNVWIDPVALANGITPVQSVLDAVAQSRLVLYLCSRATSRPPWLNVEAPAFRKALGATPLLRVLPVVLEPCDLPNFPGFHPHAFMEGSFEDRLDGLAARLEEILAKRRVFICHSHRDKPKVRRIVTTLRRHPNLSIWFDEDSLYPGAILRREIEVAIAEADYLIVVVSKNTIDTLSGWVGFELDQAYERERRRNEVGHHFAVPVLIQRGLALPGWLSTKVYVDATEDFDGAIERLLPAILVAPPMHSTRTNA